jgi:hypothetical protein
MEHGLTDNWVAPNMRYSHPGGGGPNMEHHDVSEVPIVGHGGHTTEPDDQSVSCELDGDLLDRVRHFHRALEVATSEKEHRERVERGRQRWLEINKAQLEFNQSKVAETDKNLQKRDEEEAEMNLLDAANKAKSRAFIEFKQLVTTKSRTALFLANSLRKLLKHFLFRRDHKVVWV